MIYGLGIDLVNISRMKRVLDRQGERFQQRVFGTDEISYAFARKNPAQHLAACFASKEAVIKALGFSFNEGLSWLQIQVAHGETGRPEIILSGAAEEHARKLGIKHIHLSISHDHDYAVAVAIPVIR